MTVSNETPKGRTVSWSAPGAEPGALNARRLQVCPYQLWATSLLFYFAEFPRKELVADEFVLSSRNRLILVLRGGAAAVPKHAGRKC